MLLAVIVCLYFQASGIYLLLSEPLLFFLILIKFFVLHFFTNTGMQVHILIGTNQIGASGGEKFCSDFPIYNV